jgi:dienelactone hydrolase
VIVREVTYDVDGLTMVGHLARPDGEGPWPTVLIAHDGIGVTDFQRSHADHLAERGYVALAMDYHGGRWFSDPQAMLGRVLPLLADPDRMRVIGRAALDVLLAEPGADPDRLAAMGWGAGGSIVLQLVSAGVPFRAAAVVHPGLPPARAEDWVAVRGTILVCTGSEDPLCTPDQVMAFARALQDASVDWRVNIYGGARHAFWHPPARSDGALTGGTAHVQATLPAVAYHRKHAERVRRAVLDLIQEACEPVRNQ